MTSFLRIYERKGKNNRLGRKMQKITSARTLELFILNCRIWSIRSRKNKTLMKVKNKVTDDLNRLENTISLTNQKLLQCVLKYSLQKASSGTLNLKKYLNS